MKRFAGLLIIVMLACSASSGAQSLDAGPSPSPVNDDRAVVVALVRTAVTKVRLCLLAEQKSSNADVHALCRKASRDDARAALDGMQLAKTIGATGARLEPAADLAAQLDALSAYSGADFDREFLLKRIAMDETDEDSLRYAVEVAGDVSVRRYESGLLPSIQRERDLAESALRRVSEAAP